MCTYTHIHKEGGRKLLEVMVKFMRLFMVIVSQVFTYLQTHQGIHETCPAFLYANHISIKNKLHLDIVYRKFILGVYCDAFIC